MMMLTELMEEHNTQNSSQPSRFVDQTIDRILCGSSFLEDCRSRTCLHENRS